MGKKIVDAAPAMDLVELPVNLRHIGPARGRDAALLLHYLCVGRVSAEPSLRPKLVPPFQVDSQMVQQLNRRAFHLDVEDFQLAA